MFENLFKNKTNAEATEFTITPCVYGKDSEHCNLIVKLREYQSLRTEIKNQIDCLSKEGFESLNRFFSFLEKLETNGFRMNGNCTINCHNICVLEHTINEYSSADMWRITEELKTYRNKKDIICEKQRALKAVEDDISDIKSKLGIE